MQLDNQTFERKRRLRMAMIGRLGAAPVIMETHGGIGKIYASCYSTYHRGIVFEKDPAKSIALAQQRPTWSVYRCDVVRALELGAGGHASVNFLDVDPYGECWPTLRAFFSSRRPMPERMIVCVNDGLRQAIHTFGGRKAKSMQPFTERYGNHRIFGRYKEICEEFLAEIAGARGYQIGYWLAYYCGQKENMTHFAAVLDRDTEGQIF